MANFRTGVILTGDSKGAVKAVQLTKEELRALNNVQKKGSVVGRNFSRSNDESRRSVKSLGGTVGSATKLILRFVTALGLGAGALSGVGILADFGQEMSTLKAVTSATEVQYASLREETSRLGATTRFSATQAAQGATFLARAGFDSEQVIASLGSTLLLAQSGALDLARAADIASNVLQGFRLEAGQTNRVVDVLALGANSANTSVEQLGSAMSFVAPVASVTATSLELTTAAVSALSDAGIQGERAGTSLRQILIELTKAGGDLSVEANGLVGVLETLESRNLNLADAVDLVGARQASSLLVLVDSIPKIKDLNEEFENADGTARRVAATMDDNLNGALLSVASGFEAVTIAAGDLGAESNLTGFFSSLASVLREAAANMQTVADVVVVAAVAFVARYIPAVRASITSTIAATIESVRYQGALASMAGVSRTAAVAQTALAAATTAATRAMGLFGGPAGVLLIAASAIALYASRVETAIEKSKRFASEVRSLDTELKSLSARELTLKLLGLNEQFVAQQEAISKIIIEQRQLQELRSRGLGSFAAPLKQLDERLKSLGIESEATGLKIQLVKTAIAGLTESNEKSTKKVKEKVKAVTQLNKSLIAQGAALTRSLRTPLEEYGDALDEINKLLKENAISEEIAQRARERAGDEFKKSSEVACESASVIQECLTESEKKSREAWENFGTSLKDIFVDVFTSGSDAAGDFFDRLKQTIKEFVARRLFDPIADQIANVFAGKAGNSGIGSSGIGLSSITSLFTQSGRTNLVTGIKGFFGGGASAAGSSGGGVATGAGSGAAFGGLGVASAGIFAGILAGALDIKNAEDNGLTAGDVLLGRANEQRFEGTFLDKIQPGILNPFKAIQAGLLPSVRRIISRIGGDGRKRFVGGVFAGNSGGARSIIDRQVAASGLKLTGVSNRIGDDGESTQSLFDAVLSIDSALTEVLRGNGIEIDLSNANLAGRSGQAGGRGTGTFFGQFGFNGRNQGTTLAEAADEFTSAWLKEVSSLLPRRVNLLLAGVDQTSESLVNSVASALNIDRLLDLDVIADVQRAAEELTRANRPLVEIYQELSASAVDIAAGFNGSSESIASLSDALTDQKNIASQLAAAYHNVALESNALIGSTISSIRESLLNEEELYNSRRTAIADLTAQLANTISPDEISSLVNQINSLGGTAFGSLTEDQQRTLAPEFITFLEQANQLAQQQLEQGLEQLNNTEQSVNETLAADLNSQASETNLQAAIAFQDAVSSLINNGLTINIPGFGSFDTGSIEVNI